MFDISGPEFLTIVIIALVVFGPRRLPDLARLVGRWTAEVRRAARELRQGLERDVQSLEEPLREAKAAIEGPLREAKEDLEAPLREAKEDLEAPLREAKEELEGELRATKDELDEAGKDVAGGFTWVGPEPKAGPTAADAQRDLDEIERTGKAATEPEEESP
jgi:Tat protein translocase TatB subunit